MLRILDITMKLIIIVLVITIVIGLVLAQCDHTIKHVINVGVLIGN